MSASSSTSRTRIAFIPLTLSDVGGDEASTAASVHLHQQRTASVASLLRGSRQFLSSAHRTPTRLKDNIANRDAFVEQSARLRHGRDDHARLIGAQLELRPLGRRDRPHRDAKGALYDVRLLGRDVLGARTAAGVGACELLLGGPFARLDGQRAALAVAQDL